MRDKFSMHICKINKLYSIIGHFKKDDNVKKIEFPGGGEHLIVNKMRTIY